MRSGYVYVLQRELSVTGSSGIPGSFEMADYFLPWSGRDDGSAQPSPERD